MNAIRRSALALAAGALLAACSSSAEVSDEPDVDATATTGEAPDASLVEKAPVADLSDTAPDATRIPDGTWTRTATTADARRLGLPRHEMRRLTRSDGETRIELRIDGSDWAQFTDDDGELALGDSGTAGYDADGNWVSTSNSAGCSGCTGIWAWSTDGGRLSLTLVDSLNNPDPVDILVTRFVVEGTYTLRD